MCVDGSPAVYYFSAPALGIATAATRPMWIVTLKVLVGAMTMRVATIGAHLAAKLGTAAPRGIERKESFMDYFILTTMQYSMLRTKFGCLLVLQMPTWVMDLPLVASSAARGLSRQCSKT